MTEKEKEITIKFLKEMERNCRVAKNYDDPKRRYKGRALRAGIAAVKKIMPHGEWKYGPDQGAYTCSICGRKFENAVLESVAEDGEKVPHYCPKCGGFMVGDKK